MTPFRLPIWAVVSLLTLTVAPASAVVRLEPVVSGLSSPVFVTHAGDGSGRLFVLERAGVIKVLQPGATTPTVFLDITSKALPSGGEQGLLGLAFHPQFETNRRFFVNYTRRNDGATVIAEYRASANDPDVADSAETVLLTIPQPFANHNGGMLAFGPDTYLYVGMGDGGDANDPGRRAQNIDDLLGKILRIDVDHTSGGLPYASPSTNPFFGNTPGRDEIFAYGLRNPWRFSFDRDTGQLYVGDVGQGAAEEIDIVTLGGNYGWRVREGFNCSGLDASLCNGTFVDPITAYGHTNGRCSVTGGYVYRGSRATLPLGTYVYGDYCSGEIFQLPGGPASLLLDTTLNIASFGEDEAGELYVVALGGAVYRIANDQACTYSLAPTSRSVAASGVQGATATVTAPSGCGWTAASNATWITVTSGATGSGTGDVAFSVAANTATASSRTGTLTIAGQTFTVTQAGCAVSLSPTSRSVPVTGASDSPVGVNAPAGCAWSAASNDGWLGITSGASGAGNGQVRFTAASNVGGAGPRTGTLTIGGKTFTVTQAACAFTVSPSNRSVPIGGVPSVTEGVSATAGCGWSAESNDPWITILSGASGSGNGQVALSVAANTGAARTGTLTIAGRTVTVTQSGCTYSIGPSSRSVPVGGVASSSVGVAAPAGCGWTAESNAPWITVTSPGSGAGNSQVLFSVAANPAAARTGTLTIAGRTFTVTQAGCTYAFGSSGRSVGAGGLTSGTVGVSAPGGCAWTVETQASWIVLRSGQTGAGNGQVTFSVDPNPTAAPRTGTLTLPGRTFTVTQAAGAP